MRWQSWHSRLLMGNVSNSKFNIRPLIANIIKVVELVGPELQRASLDILV